MEQIPEIVDSSWHEYLQPLFNDDRMKYIKYELLTKERFLPAGKDIFNVFSMPLDKIKVVILGQDPYPNPAAKAYAGGKAGFYGCNHFNLLNDYLKEVGEPQIQF